MVVNFNPAFRAETPVNTDVKSAEDKPIQQAATLPTKPDTVQISKSEKKPEKKGLIGSFKNAYASTKKFFITTGYMISGAAKGVVYGTFGAVVALGAAALKNTIKHKPNSLTKGNKVFAGVIGATILAGNVIAAKLNANEKNATVDHRWKTGHNDI